MEDEIRVGEYVRTETGHVGKFNKISTYIINNKDKTLFSTNFGNKTYFISYKDIIKHSFNIKDLLQVGDIIKYKIKVSTTLETKGYIEGITDITDEEHLQSIEDDENYKVLEVLTKEQYNSNRFKVKE